MTIKHSLITLSLMAAMTVAATTGAVADDRLDDIIDVKHFACRYPW